MSALPEPVEAMLAEAVIVRVATVTPSGAPHAAPFWFHYDGERIVLDTLENATVRNLRADPRVSVLVDLGTRFEELRGAMIRGRARVHGPAEAPPDVLATIEALRAAHAEETSTPQFDAYLARETRPSVFVEIAPESASWYDLGEPFREA